jgi:hypothetical protein
MSTNSIDISFEKNIENHEQSEVNFVEVSVAAHTTLMVRLLLAQREFTMKRIMTSRGAACTSIFTTVRRVPKRPSL